VADAYIFDAVRTPRGKGRKDGALHGVTPIELLTQTLRGLRDRSALDTEAVDEVVIGCVGPVGEQGANIARAAILNADFAQSTAGMQINRFCASGLEACNIAAAKVMTGEARFAIGGGVESMSRVPMFADGGAWPADPTPALKTGYTPQGIGADLICSLYGFSRDDVDAYAVESQRRAAAAWAEGRFDRSILPVKNRLGLTLLDRDEHMRPGADVAALAKLKPAFAAIGEAHYDAVAMQRYPEVASVDHVHHAGNSSGIVDG
jgi:acetyl-CoA C-acetyltransferase